MTVLPDAGPIEARPHCAKFSDPVLDMAAKVLAEIDPDGTEIVFDPFAGVGKVHALAEGGRRVVGSELEPEWAVQGQGPMIVADALRLPLADDSIGIAVTSPVYGNRMADAYMGGGRCRACQGHGNGGLLNPTPCGRCDGSGRDKSTRHTYAVSLGRKPSPGSSCLLQWGPAYRDFHRRAWDELARVVRRPGPGRPPGWALVNASDHDRKGERQHVVGWHRHALTAAGFEHVTTIGVETRRLGHGENWDVRPTSEQILVMKRAA